MRGKSVGLLQSWTPMGVMHRLILPGSALDAQLANIMPEYRRSDTLTPVLFTRLSCAILMHFTVVFFVQSLTSSVQRLLGLPLLLPNINTSTHTMCVIYEVEALPMVPAKPPAVLSPEDYNRIVGELLFIHNLLRLFPTEFKE